MPRVEHRGVDIAVRDSVADAEEHELPVAVRVDLLPCRLRSARRDPSLRGSARISTLARSVFVANLRADSQERRS